MNELVTPRIPFSTFDFRGGFHTSGFRDGDLDLCASVRHNQCADESRNKNECLHAMVLVSKGSSCTLGAVRQLDHLIALGLHRVLTPQA